MATPFASFRDVPPRFSVPYRLGRTCHPPADNLATCNSYYRGQALAWKAEDQDERYIRSKIATKFTRLLFQLVAGRQPMRRQVDARLALMRRIVS
jgi:hypothetical protein